MLSGRQVAPMPRNAPDRSLETLTQHLLDTARITDTACSEALIRRVLHTFADGFMRRSVQLRITTLPGAGRRELCFRYLDLESGRHPLELALAAGELVADDHPSFRWLSRIEERHGVLGYGVDFEAHRGLAKVWTFLAGAHEPRAFLDVPQPPPSLAASLPLLRELHLDAATIVGCDYVQRSTNLYFRPSHPSHRGPELLTRACERLGFAAPSPAALAHAARAGCIGFTYNWDEPTINRICFYVAGLARAEVPELHPLLRLFADEAPAVVADPRFILGWSHGRSGSYFKLEDDYTGDVSDVFGASMSVPRAPYTAKHRPLAASPSAAP